MDILILYGGLFVVGVSLTLCTRCMRKLEVKEKEEPASKSVTFKMDGEDGDDEGGESSSGTPRGRVGEPADEVKAVESRLRRSPRSGVISPLKHD